MIEVVNVKCSLWNYSKFFKLLKLDLSVLFKHLECFLEYIGKHNGEYLKWGKAFIFVVWGINSNSPSGYWMYRYYLGGGHLEDLWTGPGAPRWCFGGHGDGSWWYSEVLGGCVRLSEVVGAKRWKRVKTAELQMNVHLKSNGDKRKLSRTQYEYTHKQIW